MSSVAPPPSLGRYEFAAKIAAGGMASIYLARQAGAVGFSRLVAIKRLHPQYVNNPEFIAMFLDEARLAARVRHPNVVETVDVVHDGMETFIVLEYVDGEPLAALCGALRRAGELMPSPIAVAIVSSVCRGLHAAHEARGADGAQLGIVHRDVSPQNVLVGADGITRVADFGVALARGRLSQTRAGHVKGKPAYMAPEQLTSDVVTRTSDLYAAGVILWELCAGRRAYDTKNEGQLIARVASASIPKLSEVAPWVMPSLAAAVDRALQRDPADRYASGEEMADALQSACHSAGAGDVGAFVEAHGSEAFLARRAVASTLDLGAAPVPRRSQPGRDSVPSMEAEGPRAERPPASIHPPVVHEPTRSKESETITGPRPTSSFRVRRASLALAFILAVAAALATGVIATWLLLGRNPTTSGRVETMSVAVLRVPARLGAPSAVATAATVDPVAPSASTQAASADDAAAPSVATSEAAPDRIPRARRGASASTSTKSCDPPYYVDARGIRRVKRECF